MLDERHAPGTILNVGLTFEKLLIILVIAVFIVGPDRLPVYSQKLAQLVKSIKQMATGAKDRMREEMGPEFDEVDWRKLDPRQYDPRRIIRDALLEDENAVTVAPTTANSTSKVASIADTVSTAGAASAGAAVHIDGKSRAPGSAMAYDEEAT